MQHSRPITRAYQSGGFDFVESDTDHTSSTTGIFNHSSLAAGSSNDRCISIPKCVSDSTNIHNKSQLLQSNDSVDYIHHSLPSKTPTQYIFFDKTHNEDNNQLSSDTRDPSESPLDTCTEMKQQRISNRKRGRPIKRPAATEKLMEAFSQLNESQRELLDTTSWSTRSTNDKPNVWGVLCNSLKIQDNDKNRKWIANIWKSNIWSIAEQIRKNVLNMSEDNDMNTCGIDHDLSLKKIEEECAKTIDDIIDVARIMVDYNFIDIDPNKVKESSDENKSTINQVFNENQKEEGKNEASIVMLSPTEFARGTVHQQLDVVASLTIDNLFDDDFDDQKMEIDSSQLIKETMIEYPWLGEIEPYKTPDDWKLFESFDDSEMSVDPNHLDTHSDQDNGSSVDQCSISDVENDEEKKLTKQKTNVCVHKVAKPGACSLPTEHRGLINALLGRPDTDGKYEADVPNEPIELRIDQSDLDYLKKFAAESGIKVDSSNGESPSVSKRDLEWTTIFDKYVDRINKSCTFMYKDHHFSTAKSTVRSVKQKQFFMSAKAVCSFSDCTCVFKGRLYQDGTLSAKFEGKICHSPSEQRSRPCRGSIRRGIAEIMMNGQTPDQCRLKQMTKLTDEHRKFGNFNLIGASPNVFRKINSETKTSLMLDKDLSVSLMKIKEEQSKEINPGKTIRGYLQTISISPLRLIFFTETALLLWKRVGNDVPVSWDATGGVVVNKGKKVFYYELSIANISPKPITSRESSGPSFPVTAMVSTSHTTMDLIQWLHDFEAAYHRLYGFKDPFPKPPIIHSDGALVFQKAALRFFNGDSSISDYLKRCWNIVNGTAKDEDLKKTIVHSCFSHFMKGLKREAMKIYPKEKVPFALWIMSLMINANTLEEMENIWGHICTVLLCPTQNSSFSISISWLSQAADAINKDPNKSNFISKNIQVNANGICKKISTYEQCIDETELHDDMEGEMTEEDALNQSESPFRDFFNNIHENKMKNSADFSKEEYRCLPENPYFNPAYLQKVLSLYLPTAPIWSNLMMGNLSRYGYKTITTLEHCGCHNSRTTGLSESRLKVVKHTILGGEVSSRVDQVAKKLGDSIRSTEMNYSQHYVLNLTRNRTARGKKILAEESWQKRGSTPPTTTSFYSEKPKVSLVTQLKKMVKDKANGTQKTNVQTNVKIFRSKPHRMLPNNNLCWLNSSIQIILCNVSFVDSLIKSTFFESYINIFRGKTNMVSYDVMAKHREFTDFYLKLDQINFGYLSNILQLPFEKEIDELAVRTYVTDIRKHGTKYNIPKTNDFVPLIAEFGEISCPLDFVCDMLSPSILTFVDISVIYQATLTCSKCSYESIMMTENFNILPLPSQNYDGMTLPTPALKNYFREGSNDVGRTCSSCCIQSKDHKYDKNILQLPDTLFMTFMPDKKNTQQNGDADPPKYYIENRLDMSPYIASDLVCSPSYGKYELQAMMLTNAHHGQTRHYYTIAKYGDQFYRCDDDKIEAIDKSLVFGKPYTISMAMFVRVKSDPIDFVSIIDRIIHNGSQSSLNLLHSQYGHINMVFEAALEHIVRKTNMLSWNYGFTFECLQYREKSEIYGNDCLLFIADKHLSQDGDVSIDDTLIQTKLVPNIKCKKDCDGDAVYHHQKFKLFHIPKFVFITCPIDLKTTATTTNDSNKDYFKRHIYLKCDLTQVSFMYELQSIILVTKDERLLIVEMKTNNQFSVYNSNTKQIDSLVCCNLNDFIKAAATNIVVCYKTNETIEINKKLQTQSLDISTWSVETPMDPIRLADSFNHLINNASDPICIDQYRLTKRDIIKVLDVSQELNDEQLNSHLYLTSILSAHVLLFDSLKFSKYFQEDIKQTKDILKNLWFEKKIILVPVHDRHHWVLFIVDISRKTLILFNSISATNDHYEPHRKALIELLRRHHFLKFSSSINLSEWVYIDDFSNAQQDDVSSCGIHCAMFARSYVNKKTDLPINKSTIQHYRILFGLQLLQHKSKKK